MGPDVAAALARTGRSRTKGKYLGVWISGHHLEQVDVLYQELMKNLETGMNQHRANGRFNRHFVWKVKLSAKLT